MGLSDWAGPRQVVFAAYLDNGAPTFAIRDTGPPREVSTEELFTEADSLRRAIAERVCRQHGGQLQFHMGPQGSEAVLRLPPSRLAK